jgi:quercetin dioxygenase-like cupin family protein
MPLQPPRRDVKIPAVESGRHMIRSRRHSRSWLPSIGAIAIALASALGNPVVVTSRSQNPPPGITRTPLIENETVMMARLRMAPGAKEDIHTHPFSAIVVQLGGGEVDMRLGDAHSRERRPAGFVEFIPREVPHAAANVGTEPFELVTIAIKPDRRRGGDAPAVAAPAGITRTPVLDNAEARVTRVAFAPASREPMHSHPYDLVVVPLAAGRIELRLGERVETRDYAAGEPMFLPRDVPHAVANAATTRLEILSVAIK